MKFTTFHRDKNLFKFSDYLRDSKSFDLPDKKVIGKMKDEFKGNIIIEFVGLKSKIFYQLMQMMKKVKKQKEPIGVLLGA